MFKRTEAGMHACICECQSYTILRFLSSAQDAQGPQTHHISLPLANLLASYSCHQ